MAKLDMAKIKEQLAAAKRTVKKNTSNQNSKLKDLIWKPEEGENLIRMVPNQFQEKTPFIKLTFHYQFTANINNEERNITYISPSNFGKPDPIIELSERLKSSGDKKLWGKGKSLEPKARTYVPIIVRGKEEEGVKYWGFGVQIFDQLVTAMDELDSAGENITDLLNGYDIKVDFIPAEKSSKVAPDGRKFPETTIVVKRKSSPVIPKDHPKAREILDKITTKQPVLTEAWECPEYSVLAKALEVFLKKREQGKLASSGETVKVVEDENVVLPTEEQIIASQPTPVVDVVSPSATQAAVNVETPDSTEKMKDVYDELFGLK
jgi:hypothetical protein